MVILTPLIEEVISRGLILRSLLHHGRTFAVVVSAVLFALLHVYDSVPFAFVFGVIAAIQMQSAQTLWGPVIAHATYNLTVIFDQHCLNSSWVAGATSAAFTTGAILLTILTVFTAAWLARQNSAGARKASGTDFC
jgi:membrane protease YdiL (CAAX protease family)